MLDEGNVHLTTLDAGEVFIGGRYHSLIPLMQERLEGNFQSLLLIKNLVWLTQNKRLELQSRDVAFI
jgi:hypothetical protein